MRVWRGRSSGAYNRTLTPFGFQAEERTLWQAPQTYITMSPFMQVGFRILQGCTHALASPGPVRNAMHLGL